VLRRKTRWSYPGPPKRNQSHITNTQYTLAQMDLLCSGFDLAVMIVGESLVKIPPDPKFEEDMASTMNFFVGTVLPKIVKQHNTPLS
jgi:hypothetical protein